MGRATKWFKGLFGIKVKEKGSAKITGMCHNPSTIPPNISPAEAAWLRSFYSESDTEQNKHAIAVAAATAAAADAAVAAANAAVAVVRLTSQAGRGNRETLAAVKIQNVFRGYLARKALRALKGLVKIQALVRGFLVRKQAAATLHGMQALIRVQASVRARAKKNRDLLIKNHEDNFSTQYHPRKSLENNDDTGCDHPTSMHSTRLSASFEAAANSMDESPKIVEVDTGCRPKSTGSRRTNTMLNPDSNEDSAPSRIPSRISIQDTPPANEEWGGLTGGGDECHFPTAQSTPRFATSCSCNAPSPTTPAKSMCTESYSSISRSHPNYMAKTQSFKAKQRSQSAPKQRHEPGGPKRRLSLHEMMESRSSLSGVTMQRSCSQPQHQTFNFKNAVMGKLNRSSDF